MGGFNISQETKDMLNNQFNYLHQFYGRNIIIFRTAEAVVIQSNPDNNILFQGTNVPFNDTVENVTISGQFLARVRYGNKEDLEMFAGLGGRRQGGEQINLQQEKGIVRIKVDPTGASYLFDANRATFDGDIFTLRTSKRPHGLVGNPNFYDFYLQKEN